MIQADNGSVENVARLLQDPRVRATVNVQDGIGRSALHCASKNEDKTQATSILHLLLQAGGNPALATSDEQTTLAYLRQHHPFYHAAITLLEQYPAAQKDAEKATLLVKARRLIVAANSNAVTPSYLQGRVARGQPLPHLALTAVTGGQNEDEDEDEEGRKLRTTLAFMCGLGREGMPRDVHRVVTDIVMPSWDPLRRRTNDEPSLQHG